MAVVVTIDGVEYLNQTGYSVSEDSTPLAPDDTTGAVGQFSATIDEDDLPSNPRFIDGLSMELADGAEGTTIGTISGLSGGTTGELVVTADSRLSLLNAERTAQPIEGTLEEAFDYYLSLVGVNSGLVIDDTIASRSVVFQGFTGNLWDNVKKMCTAEQVEVSLVSNNIVLRPLRTRIAQLSRTGNLSWAQSSAQLARSVEIYYYNSEYLTDTLVYPSGGWTEEVQTYTVNANEVTEVDLPLSASVTSIEQPVCVSSVDRDYTATSVYTVSGNDGLIVPPAQWEAEGGSVTVTINPDTKSLRLRIVGSTNEALSQYTIGMPSGPNNYYSSLRIVGTGVFFDKQLLTVYTGVDPAKVSTEVGATIDNQFINTAEQAYHAVLWSMGRYGGPTRTITMESGGINRLGDSGAYTYPTIADFNALYPGDIASYNSDWVGDTIADVNAFLRAETASDFANQAFGNVSGARVLEEDTYYRIRPATITPNGINFTAEADTTIADWNAIWDGQTIADWNAIWDGYTVRQTSVAPLRS